MRRSICNICMYMILTAAGANAQSISFTVPAGGNSWVNIPSSGGKERVTNEGWRNWQDASAVWSTYIRLAHPGTLQLGALLNVPSGESELSFSINGQSKIIKVSGASQDKYEVGEWQVASAGYLKIDARGISKTGNLFANVKELYISGSAVDSNTYFVKNNEGNYFHWGRRGPSVHINYDMSQAGNEIEWFYNEITVPEGNDVIGSYFMADGFGEGYFGMQVNSATERRIIFSVWSPFKTDNPKEIPEDQKIILAARGKDVVANEFGNEGSGGHSHLVYPWKAGQTYRFVLHGVPGKDNHTQYTAYFYDPAKQQWMLIASFIRPATNTWLKRLHSFLENFVPETGNHTRMAYYHNQWVKPAGKDWQPLNTMFVTADATANKKYRMDYDGGAHNGMFFLKNGGFFNESGELRKPVTVNAPVNKPDVDLAHLLTLANH